MYTKMEKPKESASQLAVNNGAKNQNGGQAIFQFVDMRPETIAQRKLQMMASECVGTNCMVNDHQLIQCYVLNKKNGYRLDKFNRAGERAQEIAFGLYAKFMEMEIIPPNFDYLYDEVLKVLDPFGINDLINDDDNVTLLKTIVEKLISGEWLITAVIKQLNIDLDEDEKYKLYTKLKKENLFNLNIDRVLLALNILDEDRIPKVEDSEADEVLEYKSTEKEFIKTISGKIIAYPKTGKPSVLFEAWLYKRIKQKTEDFENELTLPNPELIYNEERGMYGIRMDEIEGENIDVYMRGIDEIRKMIVEAAIKFKIKEVEQEEWVNEALLRINKIIQELKQKKISIYDLQGILNKEGIWTIIDPLNVISRQ